jgi:hypothetical protein
MHRSADGILHGPAHIVSRFWFEGPAQFLDKPPVRRHSLNVAAQLEGDAKTIKSGSEIR